MTESRLTRLVRERIGFDRLKLNQVSLALSIESAMQQHGVHEEAQLCVLLEKNEDAWHAFVFQLINPETWFFREAAAFDVMVQGLGDPASFSKNFSRPLRILSLPCSTGEEAYSIACSMLEAGWLLDQFEVDGADICQPSLQRALEAKYRQNSFRGDQQEQNRINGFGNWQNESFSLDDRLKQPVTFSCSNLLEQDDELAADYDVVFCRNLLIYFHPNAVSRAMERLDSLLNKDGMLFVGYAEAGLVERERFVPLPGGHSCGYRKRETVAPEATISAADVAFSCKISVEQRTAAQVIRSLMTNAQTAKASVTDYAVQLARANALADKGEYRQAIVLCREALGLRPDAADVNFLLGLLHSALSETGQAERYFQKTLRFEPGHPEALSYLQSTVGEDGHE